MKKEGLISLKRTNGYVKWLLVRDTNRYDRTYKLMSFDDWLYSAKIGEDSK